MIAPLTRAPQLTRMRRLLSEFDVRLTLMFLSSLPDPADPVHDLSQLARALACCRFASVAAISLSAAVHSASRRITTPSTA